MKLLPFFILLFTVGMPPQRPPAKAPFTLVLATECPTATLGSDIWLKVRWTNTSDRALDSSANVLDATNVDPNFVFELLDANGHTLPMRAYKFPLTSGHAEFGTLKPGESITHDINLVRLYDIKQLGKYTLQVSRKVPAELGGGMVKSNKITIAIVSTPPSTSQPPSPAKPATSSSPPAASTKPAPTFLKSSRRASLAPAKLGKLGETGGNWGETGGNWGQTGSFRPF